MKKNDTPATLRGFTHEDRVARGLRLRHTPADAAFRSRGYSTRSVLAGSTCAARRAGSHVATEATAMSPSATMNPTTYGFTLGARKRPCDIPILSAATLTGNPIANPTRPVRTPDARNIRAANPDLPRPLTHRERDHAVQA